jgi:ribose transport system substrate-binding protein
VILFRHQEGVSSTTEREAGFLEAIKKIPGIEVILENRYAGATASEAQTTALNILDKIKEADGIFCPNESSTFGMLLALRQNNLTGKIKLIGFDTSPPLLDALKKGELQAVVAQNPKKMAHEGMKLVLEKIKGGEVPTSVDSGAVLVTKENLDTPEIQALLK